MRKALYILFLLPSFVNAQSIHIAASATIVCVSTPVHFSATTAGISAPHYKWKVNGANVGADSSVFTTSALNNGDSVKCLLVSSTADTVFANSDTILMTVQHMPVVSPIICSDSIICVGTTTILSDSTSGGVWGASNGNATVSAGVVTAISGDGSDVIQYSITNSCGSATATRQINIETFPNADFDIENGYYVADSSICVGQSLYTDVDIVFLDRTNDCVSFDDKDPDNESIIGVRQGIVYLINYAANVCGADTVIRKITVFDTPVAAPIVSASKTLCIGSTITITDSSAGALRWSASNDNGSMGNVLNTSVQTVTGMNFGLDTISLGITNQCGHISTYFVLAIGSTEQIVGMDSVCKGSAITLKDGTAGGAWSSMNPDIASVDGVSGVVTGSKYGSATIKYAVGASCFDTMTVRVGYCGSEPIIYPNPSNGKLIIQTDDIFYFYTFMNILGQEVKKAPIDGIITNVNIQLLPAGVYFITLYGDNKKYVSRFVKE